MKSDDYSDLTGHTITKVVIDNDARLIALTTYHSQDGWFDAAGMWIGINETQHELLFSDVHSHAEVEDLNQKVLGSITHNPEKNSYTITTQTHKKAEIIAEQLDITEQAY